MACDRSCSGPTVGLLPTECWGTTMRTLHVPLEEAEFQSLEAWRERLEKARGHGFESWREFLLYLAGVN